MRRVHFNYFALLFTACVLLFVAYITYWFSMGSLTKITNSLELDTLANKQRLSANEKGRKSSGRVTPDSTFPNKVKDSQKPTIPGSRLTSEKAKTETVSEKPTDRGTSSDSSIVLNMKDHGFKNQTHAGDESLSNLGVLSFRNATGWSRRECDKSASFRLAKLPTKYGNLSIYIYDSDRDDLSTTSWILKGQIPENDQIEKFLEISKDLPLIDVGSNLGTVALQAAMQKREVVAFEPVPSNVQRLCRSALYSDLDPYLHVLLNAVSAKEGEVTLAADYLKEMSRFSVQGIAGKQPGYEPVTAYAITMDNLLEVVSFKRAALKIDVEAHEGYVLAGSERLFLEIDIPIVWLEWEHVKNMAEYGAQFVLDFMLKRDMDPYDIMTGNKLSKNDTDHWPATILWKRRN